MATILQRPNGQYSYDSGTFGSGSYHYDRVNEVTADDTNGIQTINSQTLYKDYFNFPALGITGTINSITLYGRYLATAESGETIAPMAYNGLFLGGTTYNSSTWRPPTYFSSASTQWTVSPVTGQPFTVAEINNGSFVIGLYSGEYTIWVADDKGGSFMQASQAVQCSQFWRVVDYTPPPSAPTNVSATKNISSKVTVTWTKSTGATGYRVYHQISMIDYEQSGLLGDVATWDDPADAPVITAGTSVASDGSYFDSVYMGLSGNSITNGTQYVYVVRAFNSVGSSADSSTDTGYRVAGTVTYQWNRSAADSDASYGTISGATGADYYDTGGPAPIITAGSAVASDGIYSAKVTLNITGNSIAIGEGRYYTCTLNAPGSYFATSTADRGYRWPGTVTYQWQRSAGDSDATYSDISGATTASYNDTGAPADGSGRYFKCKEDATGSAQVISSANRGNRRYPSQLSMSQVDTFLGHTSTTQLSMNDADLRLLFGVPSGAISLGSL